MERPNVVVENGLITYVTFAVSDVDKNNQISAGTNHGSKVIVVPFDGVTFDKDTGVGTGGAGGGGGGAGGASAGTGGICGFVGKGRERWRRGWRGRKGSDGRCRRKLQRRSRRVGHRWFDRDRRRSGRGRERHRWDHRRFGGQIGRRWYLGDRRGRGLRDRLWR